MLDRFRAANTQVLGVSVDSVFSHANWGKDLGGVSFPLLSDFEPKGAMAANLGCYLPEPGLTDRATVLVDKDGVVRYAESVTPAGERDIGALAAVCEETNAGGAPALPAGQAVPAGTTLYVKSHCGHSRKALLAVDNLHAQGAVQVRNVTADAGAGAALEAAGGKDQAPCLVFNGDPIYEADAIVSRLVDTVAPI